jgi:GT2 family glycosyltransferase
LYGTCINFLPLFAFVSPLVSIVILNWNGRKYLEKFLPSVIASTYTNKEIVVADNASTDDSVSFLQQYYPQVRIIRLNMNYGFSKGYNEALKQVDATYYILLNSDVEVTPGWIEPMVALASSDKTIGICQPKLLQYNNRELFEYAGAAGGWLDYLGYPFARGRIFDFCEKDEGQYDEAEPVFWASGAALFIRKEVYHELKGFDEYFFAHQEEIDLCWRAQLAGHQVYVCPGSRVYHVGGGTLPKGNARKVFLNFRNNLVMMSKNMPVMDAWWKLFCRIWLDALSAWKSLFEGQLTYFIAVIKAHFAFIGWFLFGRKKSNFPEKKGGKLQGYLKKSVVWAHFVRGEKRFTEIVKKKN